MTKSIVINFINEFSNKGQWPQVIECFTCGNCYWFAYILHGRFPYGAIAYDEVANHFGCMINDAVYDITGDVTDKYYWEPWGEVYNRDPIHGARIIRDCIDKIPSR